MPTKVQTIDLYSGVADASGDATANSNVVKGNILAIGVVYDASSHGNTDVVVTAKIGASTQTVLTLTDKNTSGVFYPRAYAEETTGTDLTYDGTYKIPIKFPVDGLLTITIADQTAGKAVRIYVTMEVF